MALVINRSLFKLVFTATLAAAFLIVTGLIGYQPPGHFTLDAATWRRGVWADHVIVGQVALGAALLTIAAIMAVHLDRRLAASLAGRGR